MVDDMEVVMVATVMPLPIVNGSKSNKIVLFIDLDFCRRKSHGLSTSRAAHGVIRSKERKEPREEAEVPLPRV